MRSDQLPAAGAVTAAAYFVPPRFTAIAEGADIEVTDIRTRATVALGGELARDFTGDPGGAARRLRALAAVDPSLGPLADALASHRPVPWDRAALLEGSGYDRLFIELTSRCNERCRHCYAESSPERDETLPLATVLEVIDAGERLGFKSVQLTGGDPLIAPSLLPAARHARRRRFDLVEIYTNGLALKGELFEELASLGVAFAFSFYSHRPDAHDAMTQTPGSQVRTLAAIAACVAAGLTTRVSVIVSDATEGDLDGTLALLERSGLGRDAIAVDGVRTVGRGEGLGARWTRGSGRHDGAVGPLDSAFSGTLAVRADGAVVPCIFQRDVVLGSVFDRALDAIARAPVPLPLPRPPDAAEDATLERSLGCVECRLRHHLLSAEPLVQLGLRAS